MDLKRIEDLIDLMRRSGVSQLAVELPDYKISITRGPERAGGPAEAAPREAEMGEPQPAAGEQPASTAVSVVAPVVGVFYNGGLLDPRTMVQEGDRVQEGQLLAAIEAMKVPNEIRAPTGGVVSRLLVEDGAAVEYGQPLFLIEPDEGGEESESESAIGLA
jgi:acetyl-CoA carboxylase biotin carboxyl carrier protein